MSRSLAGLAALLLAAPACTHEKPLSELRNVTGGELVIETRTHVRVDGRAYPASDGVQFTTADDQVLGAEDVDKVIEIKRGRGALEGAGIGLLIGATGGAIAGYAGGNDTCTDHDCFFTLTAGEKAFLGAIAFGALGGLGGLIVGAIYGSRDEYSLTNSSTIRPITPVGPPGSTVGMTVTW